MIFVVVSDPDDEGIVNNPLKPEGFVTGLSTMLRQTTHDCLERFCQTYNALRTIYSIHRSNMHPANNAQARLKVSARRMGITYKPFTIPQNAAAAKIHEKINALPQAGDPLPAGLLMIPDDLVVGHGPQVIQWAQDRGMPTFVQVLEFVTNAGMPVNALSGYGIQAQVIGRAAATYIDEVVWKGTSPRDLPVGYLTPFEWWVKGSVATGYGINTGALPPEAQVK